MGLASSSMIAGDTHVTLEEIFEVLDREEYDEFITAMSVVEDIIENPSKYVGAQALVSAAKLAALRTKIGLRGQYYKTTEKSIIQRRRKDLLLTMFVALEENIMTLKLLGRTEARMNY